MHLILHKSDPCSAPVQEPNNLSLYTGRIIRRVREFNGASQGELARHSEAHLSYICSMESDQNNISIRKVLLLCNALALSPSNLVNIQQRMVQSADMDNQTKEQE